jgi:hypothetical protein
MLLQIIILVLLLVAWASVAYSLKRKKISRGEFFLWSILWITLLLASIFPNAFSWLSEILGIGRVVDLIIYGSVFLLFLLVFKLFVKIDSQEKEMTKLVREIAIKRVRKK